MKSLKTNLLWVPSKESIQQSNIHSFISILNQKYSLSLVGYEDLYQFSINEKKLFWSELWDFVSIIGKKGCEICTDVNSFKNAKWFPEATLNYAENLLKIRSDQIAIKFNGEHQVYQTLTFCELYDQVSKIVQFFKKLGIQKNDRIAILANNAPQTVVCVLAASALGAISSLCSTDFGAAGIIERFAQIEPVLFIYFDSAIYNGKIFSQVEKAAAVVQNISSVQNVIRISHRNQTNIYSVIFCRIIRQQ
jgi:acetoacetyl-CoA synthetase